MKGFTVGAIISLFVVILLFAILMPTAFNNVYQSFSNVTSIGATTSTPFASTVVSLAKLVPLLTIVALLISLTYLFVTREK